MSAYEHISSYPPPLAVRGAGLSRLPPAFDELLAALLAALLLLLATLLLLDGSEGARRPRFREAPTFRSRKALATLVVADRLTTGPLRGLGDVIHRALGVRVPHVRVVELRLTALFGEHLVLLGGALHECERGLRAVGPERGELGTLVAQLLRQHLLPRERGREVDAGAADGAVEALELGDEPRAALDTSAALRTGTLCADENRRDSDGRHGNGGFGEHTLSLSFLLSWFSRGFGRMPNPSLVDT